MSNLKKYVTGLAVVAFASSSYAGPIGADGFDTTPACADKKFMVNSVKKQNNSVPTGIVGSHPMFKTVEFYANLQDGSYEVLGDAESGPNKGKTCMLIANPIGFPEDIQQEPFYKKYFAQVSSNQAIIKKFMGATPTAQAGVTTVALKPQ